MPRLLGVNIPDKKKIEYSLKYIYGIGFYSAKKILKNANIDCNILAKDLTEEDLNKISLNIVNLNIKVEGDLKRDIINNIKRLKSIKSYRGIRHSKGLPVRGQRTQSNARTRKGKRKLFIKSKNQKK